MATQNNDANTATPSDPIEPRSVDVVNFRSAQNLNRRVLACSLLGLNPEVEQRALETILDDFNAMPEANRNTFMLGLAVNRLSSAGLPLGTAPPAVPMDTRPPFSGGTPGMKSFDRFPKFSGDKDKNPDELPVELWADQLEKYLPNVCGPEVGESWVTCAVRQLCGPAAIVWMSEDKRLKSKGFPVNLAVFLSKLKSAFNSGDRTLTVRALLNKLDYKSAMGVVPYCNQFQILMAELGEGPEGRSNFDYVQGFLDGLPRTMRMPLTQEFINQPDASITEYLEFARKLADPTRDQLFTKEAVSAPNVPSVQALGVTHPEIGQPHRGLRDNGPRQGGQFPPEVIEQARMILAAQAHGFDEPNHHQNQNWGYGRGRGQSSGF